jgi:hypothetical protein
MDSPGKDIRFALRGLLKKPGSSGDLLALGAGKGAATHPLITQKNL